MKIQMLKKMAFTLAIASAKATLESNKDLIDNEEWEVEKKRLTEFITESERYMNQKNME